MPAQNDIAVLNRLLRILYRSLPIYLEGIQPWTRRGAEKGLDVLAEIAADQRAFAGRVVDAIDQQGGRADPGQFPLEFTAVNDLALEFLVQKALDFQQRDVEAIQRCVDDLAKNPPLRSLAEEVLANARRHLQKLEDLTADEEFGGR